MLLCQIEMCTPTEHSEHPPSRYIVGRYGFDPGLQDQEEVWINWQVLDQNFEIKTRVVSRRKEVHVDGKNIVLHMNETEKAKFMAIYPDGIEALMNGASLFLLRIFVEVEDQDQLLRIQEAIALGEKRLKSQGLLPKTDDYSHPTL